MSKTYNLFISHSWAYSDAYEKLINLLNQRAYFIFRNFSVPKDDPIHNASNDKELYEAIKRQMYPCHIVIIMGGVYSTYSKWINKEIELAKGGFTYEKPILGVKPWANTNISTVVSDNADEIVGWNTDSIVDAIRRLAI
jgi:hypothetical protein